MAQTLKYEKHCRDCQQRFAHPNPAVAVCDKCWEKTFEWINSKMPKNVRIVQFIHFCEARATESRKP